MRKQAAIGDWRLDTLPKAWRGMTGAPVGSAAALYALGALGTYAAWPYVGHYVGDAVKSLSGDDPGDIQEAADYEKKLQANRLFASLALPAIPAGLHLLGMADFRPAGERQPYFGLTNWHDKDSSLAKKASFSSDGPLFDAIMNLPTIPLMHSTELVRRDPVLNDSQKGRVLNVFESAPEPDEQGFLTPANLAVGAVRAGAGYLAGNLAGKVMGSLFSLPKPVTSKLSTIGGIGGALINMGVV